MPTCAKRITDNARVLVRQRPGTMPAAARIAPVAARVRASARAGDLRPAQSRRCAPPAPRDAPFRGRRRDVLLIGAAAMTALGSPPAGRAEVLTPKGYEPPALDPSGWNVLTAGEDSLGCRYALEWPSGWCALSDLSSARAVGVDASFKDPRDEASTLAVFVSRVGDEVRSQRDRGSLDAVAASRADSARRRRRRIRRDVRRRDEGWRRDRRAVRRRRRAGGDHGVRGKGVPRAGHSERRELARAEESVETRGGEFQDPRRVPMT